MNADRLITDLLEIESDFKGEEKDEDFFPTLNVEGLDNSACKAAEGERLNYYSIFNIKNEYKKTEIYAEKMQISIINNLIFLSKLNKSKRNDEMMNIVLNCLHVSFENKNDLVKTISEEKSLYLYKQHLLKNKIFFLKILRKIKNRNFYPDIKQIIKDVTRDIFSFNRCVYNGSIGIERITSLLYKLLNKHFICKIKNFLLTFFLLSIMSRTNNSVDLLYILEFFYKNDNYSFIIPDSSFISPCEVTVYNNMIILKSNVKYFINLLDDKTNLLCNCFNIIYIQENLISDNFYLNIYKTLLKQHKYHYLFRNKKIVDSLNFFDVHSICKKLKWGSYTCEENLFSESIAKEVHNICKDTNAVCANEENTLACEGEIDRRGEEWKDVIPDLESIEISSQSSYDYNDNEVDIKKINKQNFVYRNDINDLKKGKKNFFYQYLIIELN
ncbi:conserved Plasmodium protein, unknown function [Plasmodium ovale]|uniref:Uncharacterized protein n=2 Tax=Plasmodium ovale TaxID=36330 RepID=A0A1A8W0I4_PLAOA|nr:conserved Plasmodium protein, unknown function [Plasmodium ovale curtisi]SCQ16166.1 conserved Plasmodium protein, unknown function [Plasmodium ovale]